MGWALQSGVVITIYPVKPKKFLKYDIFQLQRAVLGFLVISTLGFLAAFLVTNEGMLYTCTLHIQLQLILYIARGTLAH